MPTKSSIVLTKAINVNASKNTKSLRCNLRESFQNFPGVYPQPPQLFLASSATEEVNAQNESFKKYFWGSCKLPQAHKVCDENETKKKMTHA